MQIVHFGFWNETRADIEESIRVAEDLHLDSIGYLVPIPYRNTSLFSDYVREGLIKPGTPPKLPCRSIELTSEEIAELREQAQKRHRAIRLRQLLNPTGLFNDLLPKIISQLRRILKEHS